MATKTPSMIQTVMARLTGERVKVSPTLADVDAALAALAVDMARIAAEDAQLVNAIAGAWGTPEAEALLGQATILDTRRAAGEKLRAQLMTEREGAVYRHALADFEQRCMAVVQAQAEATRLTEARDAARLAAENAQALKWRADVAVSAVRETADMRRVLADIGLDADMADAPEYVQAVNEILYKTGRRPRPQGE